MRTSLTLLLVMCLCLASLSSVSGMALFTNTGLHTGGVTEGGVLDLKLSEVGPATAASTTDDTQRDTVRDTFEDLTYVSSDTLQIGNTLRVENTASSLPIEQISVVVSYTESDGVVGQSGNANATARTISIDQFTYNDMNLLNTIIQDENGNGRIDIEDLTLGGTKQNLTAISSLQAGDTADLTITLSGDVMAAESIGSEDGLNITIQLQGSTRSFTDRDTSINNTIRYA